MADAFKAKWEESQMENWKKDMPEIIKFFKRFNMDIEDTYKHVLTIDYKRTQAICYLLSKIDKAIKICDFLDTLKDEDVDVIKIYILTSHAEIASRSLGEEGSGIELVKKFFEAVESKLQYKLKATLETIEELGDMNFADVLYKIRCEYTHEGNYTGKIFKNLGDDIDIKMIFRFRVDGKDVFGETNLTYQQFINIYMRALIENIKIFSDYMS